MKHVEIPRRSGLSRRDILRDHLRGSGSPVILTDTVPRWPAFQNWSFEGLTLSYGSEIVLPSLGFAGGARKLTKLSAYLRYLEDPSVGLGGFWVDADCRPTEPPANADGSLMYLMGWNAFQRHPELLLDIQPAPAIPDWTLALAKLPRALRFVEDVNRREYWSLYIGPADMLTTLHQDFGDSLSCLSMVRGTKRVILFPPDDSSNLYGGSVDPEHPNYTRFPRLAHATAHEGVIGPGEMLLLPPNWWHWLRATEKFMTVSHNFFNQVNARRHLRSTLGNARKRLLARDRKAWRG